MVDLRLFLPASWTSDPARMAQAEVPVDRQVVSTKPDIAIEEIDRVRAAGVRFGRMLADAGYGMSAPFRQALKVRLETRGRARFEAVPARSPSRPPIQDIVWVAGRGSGPAPPRNSRFREFPNSL